VLDGDHARVAANQQAVERASAVVATRRSCRTAALPRSWKEPSATIGEIKRAAALALVRLEPHVRGDERLALAVGKRERSEPLAEV
jgi:hypothetical protein